MEDDIIKNARPITTKAERLFLYRNSAQLAAQTGFQGHLRGDFDRGGALFYTSFFPAKNPYDEGFSEALQEVIDTLHKDGCLQSFDVMRTFCYEELEPSRIQTNWGTSEYAFRIDHGGFAFLFRLLPRMGDYHVYCWCYRSDWFNQHLEKARNGIHFVDTAGNELFRLEDGGKFRLESTVPDMVGNFTVSEEIQARYVDDTHLELPSYTGSSIYSITEYAELLAKDGKVPKPSVGEIRKTENEKEGE